MAYKRILCHVCCAPCYVGVYPELAREAEQIEGFFYNPNIQPLLEFRRRLKSAKVLAEQMKIKIHFDEEYRMRDFLRMVANHEDERCPMCYGLRLRKTAEYAGQGGFDAFTTTLLISTHQDHDAIARIGREVAADVGVEFLYRDFRHLAESSHREAKRRNLYLQQYCGCIYSEYDRFKETTKHLFGAKAADNR